MVFSILKNIVNEAAEMIQLRSENDAYIKTNTLHTLYLMTCITKQSQIVEDKEMNLKSLVIEDIEPVGTYFSINFKK